MPLLEVSNLKTHYFVQSGAVKAVDGVSFEINEKETMGLAGESGCGKTTLALSFLKLVPEPGRIVDGKVFLRDEEITGKNEKDMEKIRWHKISLVFQSAMNAFNPMFKIEDQIAEAIILHQPIKKTEAKERAQELLDLVGISPSQYGNYPHEYSGGMKQRAMISMAIANNPDFLILDEPTTALDVVTQAQILKLINELQEKLGISILLITHDLPIIAQICGKIAVMYAGKIVEYGNFQNVIENPKHPYSRGMIEAFPTLSHERGKRLAYIPGEPPNLVNPPPGCRFHPRCPHARKQCSLAEPEYTELKRHHHVACNLYQ